VKRPSLFLGIFSVACVFSAPLLADVEPETGGGAKGAAGAVMGQAMSRLASEDVLALDGRFVGGSQTSCPTLGFTYTITFKQTLRLGVFGAEILDRNNNSLLGGMLFGLRTPQSPFGNTSIDLLLGAKEDAKFFVEADLGFPLWRESVHFLMNKLKYGFDARLGYRYEQGLKQEDRVAGNQHGLVLGLDFGIHFYR